jgi:hypothetical protein
MEVAVPILWSRRVQPHSYEAVWLVARNQFECAKAVARQVFVDVEWL